MSNAVRQPRVRVFCHAVCEEPGYLSEVLAREGIRMERVSVDQGDPTPQDLDGIGGLVFMGGPMGANDDLPWIGPELEVIHWAIAQGVPVLGHCLGAQLIARAMGAAVHPNPVKEIGWYPIERIDNPLSREWVGELGDRFEVFHWHGDTFEIPVGATPIFRSPWCERQGFVRDNVVALQFHLEMTEQLVEEWAGLYREDIARSGPSIQPRMELMRDLGNHIRGLNRLADRIYGHWLGRVRRFTLDQRGH